MRRVSLLVAGSLALATRAGIGAAEPADPNGAAPERPVWTLSGEARLRPEYRDDADLDEDEDDDTRLGLMRLRLGLDVTFREAYRLFVQAQDARVAGEEGATTTNEKNLDLHQGYLELKPTRSRRLSFRLGRQELSYGDERIVGAFGWDNIGRSFDAAKARYERGGFRVDGFAARVTSRPGGAATTGSDLYGVYAHRTRRPGAEYEAYLLSFQDAVRAPGETGEPGDTAIHGLGVRIKETLGPFDGVMEGMIQTGRSRGDDHAARAFGAQAGWTIGATTRTRLFAGYDFATGDEDPLDGDAGEFFNFFPTNHLHYGYADYEGWRNLRSPWGGVSVTRGMHFARAAFHRFLLEEEAGPWKSAGGAVLGFDPAGASGTNVGGEADLTYRLTLPQSCWVEAGVSRFAPSRFARATRGDDPSWWGYLMLTWRFST